MDLRRGRMGPDRTPGPVKQRENYQTSRRAVSSLRGVLACVGIVPDAAIVWGRFGAPGGGLVGGGVGRAEGHAVLKIESLEADLEVPSSVFRKPEPLVQGEVGFVGMIAAQIVVLQVERLNVTG